MRKKQQKELRQERKKQKKALKKNLPQYFDKDALLKIPGAVSVRRSSSDPAPETQRNSSSLSFVSADSVPFFSLSDTTKLLSEDEPEEEGALGWEEDRIEE